MQRHQILEKLKARFKDASETDLKEVAYNLTTSSTTEANLYDRAMDALSKMELSRGAVGPLQQADEQQQLKTGGKKCPLCKNKMVRTTLLEDRAVNYCMDHKVCEPLPVDMFGVDIAKPGEDPDV
jgi:hypothetical protein